MVRHCPAAGDCIHGRDAPCCSGLARRPTLASTHLGDALALIALVLLVIPIPRVAAPVQALRCVAPRSAPCGQRSWVGVLMVPRSWSPVKRSWRSADPPRWRASWASGWAASNGRPTRSPCEQQAMQPRLQPPWCGWTTPSRWAVLCSPCGRLPSWPFSRTSSCISAGPTRSYAALRTSRSIRSCRKSAIRSTPARGGSSPALCGPETPPNAPASRRRASSGRPEPGRPVAGC